MLYTSMTGATQMLHAQAVTANNLANANTTGFKQDLTLMVSKPVDGENSSRHYGVATTMAQDFNKGSLITTNNSLDIAIEGEGWIAVVGQDGTTGYTRAGSLNVGGEGILRNREGQMGLGNEGPIAVPPDSRVEIANDGSINVFGTGAFSGDFSIIDRIMLVNPAHGEMAKGLDGLFRMKSGGEALPAAEVRVKSGVLEGSNVSAIEAMTEIIQSSRQYEMQVKMMKSADELATKSSALLRMN